MLPNCVVLRVQLYDLNLQDHLHLVTFLPQLVDDFLPLSGGFLESVQDVWDKRVESLGDHCLLQGKLGLLSLSS